MGVVSKTQLRNWPPNPYITQLECLPNSCQWEICVGCVSSEAPGNCRKVPPPTNLQPMGFIDTTQKEIATFTILFSPALNCVTGKKPCAVERLFTAKRGCLRGWRCIVVFRALRPHRAQLKEYYIRGLLKQYYSSSKRILFWAQLKQNTTLSEPSSNILSERCWGEWKTVISYWSRFKDCIRADLVLSRTWNTGLLVFVNAVALSLWISNKHTQLPQPFVVTLIHVDTHWWGPSVPYRPPYRPQPITACM